MADEAWARQLHDDIRQRVLRRLLRSDARVSAIYERVGARLRQRFRLVGMTDAEVAQAIEEEFRAVEALLLPQLERDLEEAATNGDEAARRTLEGLAAISPEGRAPFSRSPASQKEQPALRLLLGSGGRSPSTG